MATFQEVLTEAINDAIEHGYDSTSRLEFWLERLRVAALESMTPAYVVEQSVRDYLTAVYTRSVDRGGILKRHPGLEAFTLQRVKPELRAELDRRIFAAADLIKINREASIATTLQRFRGWMTSIPKGGTDAAKRLEVKARIRKSIPRMKFEERRVAIDQSAKLVSSLNEILAVNSGALAAKWRSNWRQPNYNYREDHKERDDRIYAVRGNWALKRGLMKAGPDGYVDDVTRPGEEVYCRCYYVWINSLTQLPPDMLTKKGREALADAKAFETA